MPTDATGREIIGYDAQGSPIYASTTAGGKTSPTPAGPIAAPGAVAEMTGVQVDPNPTPVQQTGYSLTDLYHDVPLLDDAVQSFTDPQGFVNNLLNGGGGADRYEQQVALAKGQVAQPNANAQELYGQALINAARASGYQGPSAVTTQEVTAPTISGPAYMERANYWNSAPTQAEAVDAFGRIQQAATTDVRNIPKAVVDSANTAIAAPRMGEAAQTGGVTVGRVQADPLAESLRAEAIRSAQGIATAPGAAKATFEAGQAQAVREALGVAAQARGQERASQRREAILAAEQGGLAASLQAAALAAKEEQEKRVASATALAGIRGQDITSAAGRQQIEAQRASLQAQIDANIATGNTAAVNALRTRQSELELEARKAEVSGALQRQGYETNLAEANLGVAAQTALTDAATRNKAAADYTAARNAEAAAAAARQTGVNVTNTALGVQQAESNLTRAAQIEQQNIANAQAVRQRNAELGLAAQTTTAANQLTAGTQTAQNELAAEQLRRAGTTSAIQAGTGATGIQADTARTVVDANKSASEAASKDRAATIGAIGALGAAVASDARVKEDVSPVGTGSATYDEFEERTRRMYPSQLADTRRAFDAIERGDTAPTPNSRDWAQFFGQNASRDYDAMNTAYMLKKAAMRGETGEQTSDERTKREVDGLDNDQIQKWAEKAAELPVTFRYKPGIEDNGEDPHLGLLAQDLEGTGPLGKIMVHRDQNNVRSVEYGPTALMMGKAAFDRATEARDLARALASAANGAPPEVEDMSGFGPGLALAAARSERRKAVR